MRVALAGPGHGGSCYRVQSKDVRGEHVGVVQQRRGIFWHTIGDVQGPTATDALRAGRILIEKVQHEGLPDQRKVVTYL